MLLNSAVRSQKKDAQPRAAVPHIPAARIIFVLDALTLREACATGVAAELLNQTVRSGNARLTSFSSRFIE